MIIFNGIAYNYLTISDYKKLINSIIINVLK